MSYCPHLRLAHIREEIAIIMSKDLISDEYDLVVERPSLPSFKVRLLAIQIRRPASAAFSHLL